jgi:hypothetical protein
MSENYDPIDSLVTEVKGNMGFLNRMLFPRISIIVGTVGLLIAIALLIK